MINFSLINFESTRELICSLQPHHIEICSNAGKPSIRGYLSIEVNPLDNTIRQNLAALKKKLKVKLVAKSCNFEPSLKNANVLYNSFYEVHYSQHDHHVLQIYTYTSSKNITNISFHWLVNSLKLSETIFNTISNWHTIKTNQNRLGILVSRNYGLCVDRMEIDTTEDLITDNYSSSVVEDYLHIKEDLINPTPCGRLILLDGPPGTGKSYMVRGLINELDANFIFIPSNLVASIQGPDLIKVILSEREDNEKPIIFIIEDADNCLLPRMQDNMTSLSVLLNLGDGLIGGMFNIRVLATTNAKVKEIDPALLRAGRLCRRINIKELSPEQSTLVSKKINKNIEYDIPMRLSDIYAGIDINKDNQTVNFGFI